MKGHTVPLDQLQAPVTPHQTRVSLWDEALEDLTRLQKHQAYLFPLEEIGATEKKELQALRASLHAWLKKHELFHRLFSVLTIDGLVVGVRPTELARDANDTKKSKQT